jgi:cysteine synthase
MLMKDFAAELQFEALPEKVLKVLRRSLLDTIGVAAIGSQSKMARIGNHAARDMFGPTKISSARCLFDGNVTSEAGAAMAGAISIDSVDAHDGTTPCKGHAGSAIFPALFALADGRSLMGQDLATYLALAYEVSYRAGLTQHDTCEDYHTSGAWTAVGVAAMTARVLGGTAEIIHEAAGIGEYHGPRSQMMRCIDYPTMVRDFQSVIGEELRGQMDTAEGRLPDTLVACIGGGSNAIGLFHPFLDDADVRLIGVEAAGKGIESGEHAASISGGNPGVLHGNRTFLLQEDGGQIKDAHSISAGLDYPGIGPEHSWLHLQGRVDYVSATDQEALDAFQLCSRLEGIIPALEPSHALSYVGKIAPELPADHLIVMNLCGRGDKDVFTVADALGIEMGGEL